MGLLPAYIEIMLAVGDLEQARVACDELEEASTGYESDMLGAMVAYAQGAFELAGGDAQPALVALRRAAQLWQELEAPYEAARTRVLVGLACRAVGDHEAAALELEAARSVFAEARSGAGPRRRRLARSSQGHRRYSSPTVRELQVLRLVAAGRKAIAAELVVSERTIDRHVSNIFPKLQVSSRAAATAYA